MFALANFRTSSTVPRELFELRSGFFPGFLLLLIATAAIGTVSDHPAPLAGLPNVNVGERVKPIRDMRLLRG